MTSMSTSIRRGPALRAVLYLRQSVSREESISLELQETAGRAYAQQQGYEVVAVESDPGISGRTWNRPAVQRVMAMIEAQEADVIVLWKWSRLSRSRLDWAVAVDKVESAGGRIESATEAIDVSTSTGRLARGMLTEFAAFESERIGDVWKEAQARRVSQGIPSTGRARFGYSYNRDTGFTPDPVTGPILAETYRRYISGESFRSITLWLSSIEAPKPEGYSAAAKPWNITTIRRILDTGFGAGLFTHHGKLLPGIHESVITNDEWAEYQARRATRRTTRSGENTKHLLTGLLYCHACGSKMYGVTGGSSTLNGAKYNVYRCNSLARNPHPGGTVSALRAHDALLDWLKIHAQAIDAEATKQPTIQKVKADPRPALRRSLIKVSSRLDKLTIKLLDETIPQDAYERLRDILIGERVDLEARILDADVETVKPAESLVPGLIENWDVFPLAVKRDLVQRIVGRIEVLYTPPRNTVLVRGRWEA